MSAQDILREARCFCIQPLVAALEAMVHFSVCNDTDCLRISLSDSRKCREAKRTEGYERERRSREDIAGILPPKVHFFIS